MSAHLQLSYYPASPAFWVLHFQNFILYVFNSDFIIFFNKMNICDISKPLDIVVCLNIIG